MTEHGYPGIGAGILVGEADKKPEEDPSTFPSGALRINLERTAVPVRIPPEQGLLTEILRDKVGLHAQTEALLREANHPYANWDELVEPLRSRALGDFYDYNKHEAGGQALDILFGLLFRALEQCKLEAARERALLSLLDLVELVLTQSGARWERNRPPTEQALSRLETWFHKAPSHAAKAAPKLRRLIRTVPHPSPDALPLGQLAHLYLCGLEAGYQVWLSQDDLAAWVLSRKATLFEDRDYGARFQAVSHQQVRGNLQRVRDLLPRASRETEAVLDEALPLPDVSQLAQTCLKTAYALEDPKDPHSYFHKIHVLIRLMELPALSDRYEQILRELGRCLEKMREQEESSWEALLQRLFGLLREKVDRYQSAVLDCIVAIGTEVIRFQSPRLQEIFLDGVISLGFANPDRKGVNRDWQAVVNPYHLKNVRSWLALIRMDPAGSRKLISALLINLKLGGLFISDTDLFQKDIAQLLSTRIQPNYFLIKSLCRVFPVYFHEIGAEGALRDTSTAVDEVCNRDDVVIHFLRKQCHVESNNQIVDFMEKIVAYWRTGAREHLKDDLPPEIYEQIRTPDPFREEIAPILDRVLPEGGTGLRGILARSPEEVLDAVERVRQAPGRTRRKAGHFLDLYRMLVKKYTINHFEILKDLKASTFFAARVIEELEGCLRTSDHAGALDLLLHGILPVLRQNVLSEEPTVEQEEIYRKRHIAAGIPSMYGRYKEKRFDSLGLTFRLESLAEHLFDELASGLNLGYVTRSLLEGAHRILRFFSDALEADGIVTEALVSNLDLLKYALATPGFTIDQYLNIFQFIVHTVKDIIQAQYIAVHEPNLRTIVSGLVQKRRPLPFKPGQNATPEEITYQAGEWFIRDLLAGSFAIQRLDLFVGRVLGSLAKEKRSLDPNILPLLLRYDPDRCFTSFESVEPAQDTQIQIGSKGYYLKRLTASGYPVPPGFVITTELFRCRPAIEAYPAVQRDFLARLRRELGQLERSTGKTFGDPRQPLLLSVRSGSTISMPGMMTTFLNIGINEEITASLSRQPRFEWAAWDNYRRFLQCWGMSFGIPRDRFDELMNEVKTRFGAAYKRDLLPEQMRDLAFQYKRLVEAFLIEVPTDPWEQLRTAITQVLESWHAEIAGLYREAMKIAEEWGTAVIVQQMVFGNLDHNSGTGVAFTRNPKGTTSAVSLYGDYTVCAQGEDVVSGLVETHPISEEQRLGETLGTKKSLETEFPGVYRQLKAIAEELVHRRGYHHQEIEFTYEGASPDALYILQTRNIVPPREEALQVFVPDAELKADHVGTGIGVGGGALCGIAVHGQLEIERFRKERPGTPLILLRPDTVPDDIGMILKVDGVLTARGGSTSHAAVTAYRLGKTCVVGCRELRVREHLGVSTIQDHAIHSGDWLGVDGHNGFIYKGRHATMAATAGWAYSASN